MKNSKISFLLLAALAPNLLWSASAATQLQGAGATFPAPLYQRWIAEYTKGNPDIQINYQGVGSGAGIKQFTQKLVAFGASDAAMKDEEIAAVKQGVVLIPATAGSIVLAYNLPGVENLSYPEKRTPAFFWAKSRSGMIRSSPKRTRASNFRRPGLRFANAQTAVEQLSFSPST